MVNIDFCGVIVLLRQLVAEGKTTKNEAHKIAARIAAQSGADILISF